MIRKKLLGIVLSICMLFEFMQMPVFAATTDVLTQTPEEALSTTEEQVDGSEDGEDETEETDEAEETTENDEGGEYIRE